MDEKAIEKWLRQRKTKDFETKRDERKMQLLAKMPVYIRRYWYDRWFGKKKGGEKT